jgi:hypothetical protein
VYFNPHEVTTITDYQLQSVSVSSSTSSKIEHHSLLSSYFDFEFSESTSVFFSLRALFEEGCSDAGTKACFEGDTMRLLSSGSSSYNFRSMKLERESATVFLDLSELKLQQGQFKMDV